MVHISTQVVAVAQRLGPAIQMGEGHERREKGRGVEERAAEGRAVPWEEEEEEEVGTRRERRFTSWF